MCYHAVLLSAACAHGGVRVFGLCADPCHLWAVHASGYKEGTFMPPLVTRSRGIWSACLSHAMLLFSVHAVCLMPFTACSWPS